jgi:hypothetical protein
LKEPSLKDSINESRVVTCSSVSFGGGILWMEARAGPSS